MEVLLVGGYGFIGSQLAKRLYKEGDNVTIIDNSDDKEKGELALEHIAYKLDAEAPICEIVFEAQRFDAVIYLVSDKDENKYRQGLLNIAHQAITYQSKQFIVLSIGGSNSNDWKVLQTMQNEFKSKFKEEYTLFSQMQVGNTYGPMQHYSNTQDEVTKMFIEKNKSSKDILQKIRKSNADGIPYYYIEDVTDAIYKVIDVKKEGIIDLASPKDRKALGWQEKYTLEEGIKKTKRWYSQNYQKINKRNDSKKEHKLSKILPYIENILAFVITFLIAYSTKDSVERYTIFPVDIHLIYIFIIGIVYGMKQGIIAAILASLSHIIIFLSIKPDIAALVYNRYHIVQLIIYVVVATVTSYITSNRKREIDSLKNDLKGASEKEVLMEEAYTKVIDVKNELQEQVLGSEDNLGRMYSFTQELNSLLPEDVFFGAIKILEQMLKTQSISIYKYNEKDDCLRLITRSKKLDGIARNLIDTKEENKLRDTILNNSIHINKDLDMDLPIMSASIRYEGKVVAVIFVEQFLFKNLNLYYTNFFRVCSGMIENSIGQAMKYQEAISDKKCYPETLIHIKEHFKEVVDSKERAMTRFGIPYTLVQVGSGEKDAEINLIDSAKKLSELIRNTDYLGEDLKGNLCILLSNTDYENSDAAIKRLEESSINLQFSKKVKL